MILRKIFVLFLFVGIFCVVQKSWANFVPSNGFVPNEETAVKIAEAVWRPIYGNSIDNEKPYKAKLIKKIWYVDGSLNCPGEGLCVGGSAHCEINQMDGRILKVIHYK